MLGIPINLQIQAHEIAFKSLFHFAAFTGGGRGCLLIFIKLFICSPLSFGKRKGDMPTGELENVCLEVLRFLCFLAAPLLVYTLLCYCL